ncbi:hypothetical protein [Carnobacterium iners]|uniref:hypothetical protein n=1 Tax=Carnobacterium iners TaxID=1073423 RepID=UPI00115F7AD6|nr:hypothetical protein [Carnobacterium iners]
MKEFIRFMLQLILIDSQLTYYNGCYWSQMVRKISQVPIIFISSRNENMGSVMAIRINFIVRRFF